MNQILVGSKVYVTPRLKRKKLFYKIQFILSLCLVIVCVASYGVNEYKQIKSDRKSQEMLNNSTFGQNDFTVQEEPLVVALNENVEQVEDVPNENSGENTVQESTQQNNEYVTENGTKYTIDSILNIPSLEIKYPVLSDTSDELLKISLNKFWGGDPNTVGNYCVVGHNYDGKDIFFGKLNKIQNGDIVELQDSSGKTLQYKVYNKFVVEPTDVACTSQLTNGKVEMTLITCYNFGKQRLVVKCRAI